MDQASEEDATPYLFTGKELDEETGLYCFGARYYDPQSGLWQSADDRIDGLYSSTGLNLYSYVGNRLLVAFDPDGREKVVLYHPKEKGSLPAAAKNYPDDDATHVFAHGAPNQVIEHDNPRFPEGNHIRTAKQMTLMLKRRSEYFKRRRIVGVPRVLVLHTCRCAKGEKSLAEKVSSDKQYQADYVVGPDQFVWGRDGEERGVFDDKPNDPNNPVLNEAGKPYKRIRGKEGVWRVFHRGKEIATMRGTWKPSYKDIEKVIKDYERQAKSTGSK